jgi:hypothetical protein
MLDRAGIAQRMFPEFRDVAVTAGRPDAGVVREQREFFQALSAGMTAQKKLDLWIAVFPNMGWAQRPEIRAATTQPVTAVDKQLGAVDAVALPPGQSTGER